ncbi:hypothetical protein Glove_410g17 [Diversispora epigaea]|uniref:Uncharacterized protein n=1 Tax=Diversispora epigaea TaxID=1348612 RepID=A0A397H2K5_9GLOM|nr:hypothetical protein Glove_410g17 [Diversispora epigaea]
MIFFTADEFKLEELTNKLEILIIEIKDSLLRTHFSFIYHSIFRGNDFKKLKNFCNDIVLKCPKLIFDSSDFTSLEESSIVSLLKRDNLQIEENLGLVIPIKIPLKLPVFKSKENELLTLEGYFDTTTAAIISAPITFNNVKWPMVFNQISKLWITASSTTSKILLSSFGVSEVDKTPCEDERNNEQQQKK